MGRNFYFCIGFCIDKYREKEFVLMGYFCHHIDSSDVGETTLKDKNSFLFNDIKECEREFLKLRDLDID